MAVRVFNQHVLSWLAIGLLSLESLLVLEDDRRREIMATEEHKDKTVLYYSLGKVLFDPKFRDRLFDDPERAATSTGLDPCVIEALQGIGREGLEEFVKKYDEALQKAAYNAQFC